MAVIQQNPQDNNQNNQQPQLLGSNTAPGSTGMGPQSQNQGDGSSPSQPKGSGRFVNLQQYLNANQGAGEQIGSQIGGMATKQANTLDKQTSSGTDQIRQNVQNEQNRLSQGSNLINQVGQQGGAENVAQNNLADWQKIASGQNNSQDLTNQANTLYNQYGQNISQLGNLANQAGTESGRFGLLKQTFNNPSYSGGQSRLDQMLLQNSGGGQAVNQLGQQLNQNTQAQQTNLNNLQQQINPALTNIGTQATQEQTDAKNAIGDFSASGAGALGGLYNQLSTAQQAAQNKQAAQVAQLQQELSSGKIDANLAKSLGLNEPISLGSTTPQMTQNITNSSNPNLTSNSNPFQKVTTPGNNGVYPNPPQLNPADTNGNVDLTQWFNPEQLKAYAGQVQPQNNISLADVAQQGDISKLNALQQLAGVQPGQIDLGQKSTLNPGAQFDVQGLINSIKTAQLGKPPPIVNTPATPVNGLTPVTDNTGGAVPNKYVAPDGSTFTRVSPSSVISDTTGRVISTSGSGYDTNKVDSNGKHWYDPGYQGY